MDVYNRSVIITSSVCKIHLLKYCLLQDAPFKISLLIVPTYFNYFQVLFYFIHVSKINLIAWDEAVLHRQEDEEIVLENEIATGIDEGGGREREDEGTLETKKIYNIH